MTDCDKGCIILSSKSSPPQVVPHLTLPSESESLQTTSSPRLHHPGFDPLVPACSSGFLPLLSKASLSIDGHGTRGPFTFTMPLRSPSNPASPAWSSALVCSPRSHKSKVHSSYGGGRGSCPALQPSYWLLLCTQSPIGLSIALSFPPHPSSAPTAPLPLAAHHSTEITYLKATRDFHVAKSRVPILSPSFSACWKLLLLLRSFPILVSSDSVVKNRPALQETQVLSLDQEDPLDEEMATGSSILAWRIPWTEEPGGATVHGISKSRT